MFCKCLPLRFAVPALLSKLLYSELKSLKINRRISLFNFVFLSLKLWFQIDSRITGTHFASVMTWNNLRNDCRNGALHFQITFSLSSTSCLLKLSSVQTRPPIISFGLAMWPPAGQRVEAALYLRGITEFNLKLISATQCGRKSCGMRLRPNAKPLAQLFLQCFYCFLSIG